MTTVRQLHQERGMTIVHITHFMEEAVDADRIVVMDQGRLVAQGKPREIFAQADRMKDLGLDVPLAAELASQLRKKGVPLPQSILTDEELVAALTQ